MPKIIVCQGPPASGKTTWAKRFAEENDHWIRLNKDDIRRMLGTYWDTKREYFVECCEYSLAEEAALCHWNIIIDDTNLNDKYIRQWKDFANDWDYEIEFKMFSIPMDEAINRDANRDNPVGEDVIKSFYQRYYAKIFENV